MAVKVLIRKYSERYKPTNVDWLLGNVGDWQKLNIDVEAGIDYFPTQSKMVEVDFLNKALILTSGENWGDFGFLSNKVIHIKFKFGNTTNGVETVTDNTHISYVMNVYGSTLVLSDSSNLEQLFVNCPNLPFNNGKYRIFDVVIYSLGEIEGLSTKFAHIPNSDVDNGRLTSLIDGTTTEFSVNGLNTLPLQTYKDMTAIGMQSGSSVRNMRIKKTGQSGFNNYKTHYEIEVEYMISTIFEQITDLENRTIPEYLEGDGSITDNINFIFFPKWNNPNAFIQNDIKQTRRLGNTGWFNENFNQLPNDFNVESLKYFDENNNQVETLSYGGKTKVQAIISGIPNLSSQTKVGIGFFHIPLNEEDYKNKQTPFYKNVFASSGDINNAFSVGTVYPSTYPGEGLNGASMDMQNISLSAVSGNLVCEFVLNPTAEFMNMIDSKDENDRNFVIYVSVANQSLVWNFSDRVSLLLDFNKMDLYVPPIGAYEPMSIGFVEHPFGQSENIRTENCGDFMIEDDLLAVVPLGVDISKPDEIPTKIEFVFEVKNQTTGQKYELQRYPIDLTGFPTDGNGIPQWDFDEIRGFKLGAGNNKNWVKVKRDSTNDVGNIKAYLCHYGFKIRWEDWIQRTGVPNDFFNASELNNGFNNDWFQYLKEGWDFNFTVYTYASLNGQNVKYTNERKMVFKDYDSNENVQTEWAIKRESDNTYLPITVDALTGKPLGVLLKDERVILQVKYTKTSGSFAGAGSYYGTICIEVDKGAGQMEFRQLSSVWDSEADNPLKPISGETHTKISKTAPNEILLECAVDPSLLQNASRFKLSSRLGCLFECEDLVFDDETKLFIFFDSSGSMNSTLPPLNTMRDTLLKDRLLPIYDNDSDKYDENVKVISNASERTFDILNLFNETPPSGNVVVLTFQDEAVAPYYNPYGLNFIIKPLYYSDMETFKDRLSSFPPNYYRGCIFQVTYDRTPLQVKFKEFIQMVENGITPLTVETSLADRNEVNFYYDVTNGGTPQYYMDLIVNALNNLGYNI